LILAGEPIPFSNAALFPESDHTIPFACTPDVYRSFEDGKIYET
jgi:hypothetical protein